ncbi:thiopeptide-type bacteriocin biosynthesis protein [Actinomadura gamaensis]|uniref:Thiopeptide-type bacteriocin biosynthesis protein n=1 Tax=Actinomadura gamaensis TaxID=1763541 RepID=A0ABV9TNR8_9ACTN
MKVLTEVLDHLDEQADEGRRWLEVRLLVGTDPLTRGPRIPWARLDAAVARWRSEQRFEQCFFVRKYPGLRLRFSGPGLAERLTPDLAAWVEDETGRGELAGHRFAVYEPELRRFGGPAGMDAAHRHWDQDTRLVLGYEAMCSAMPVTASPVTVGASRLWAAMVNHLLRLCLEDAAEVWDVWKRLDTLIASASASGETEHSRPQGIDPALARGLYQLSPELLKRLVPAEVRILLQAAIGNQRTAKEIGALDFHGGLAVGKRSWLTANATFQCNRWGLGLRLGELRSVTEAMTLLLQPDRQGTS